MYNFSGKIKVVTIILMVLGGVLFGIGYSLDHSKGLEYINQMMAEEPELFYGTDAAAMSGHHGPEHDAHMEHLLNQLHNKPWAAFYVSSFLFLGISLASLFFFSIQQVAQAGWPHVMIRVMEGIASFLPVGGLMILIVLLSSVVGWNHLFHWMDDRLTVLDGPRYDVLLDSKKAFLNKPLFAGVAIGFVLLWSYFLYLLKKNSRELDENSTKENYLKLYNNSVKFLVVFAISSMTIGIYWIMSLDPHWYSTLFGWYLMVSYLVTAVAFMILISLFLKGQGLLPKFNDHHLHDLTKYLFAFSMLWSYLWFCQFMLIWYANIPEETVYFLARFEQYGLFKAFGVNVSIYVLALIPNLILPLLVLVASKAKRKPKLIMIMCCVIIFGHYLDVFNVIMPATVGPFWEFGFVEIGSFLFMLGLFGFVVMRALSKLELEPKGHPMFHESELYEYPF